ncbi:MAG: UDP-N-acetylmuramoyl-L-alanine--D-glutamate ligase [Bacilli bacterium]|nr:UDP-N-acetylmuramoyl-L-alanine--D-glutamate ligase [Bacilli bacterium]
MFKKIIDDIKGKNVAILGFGMEGISTYHFIRKYSNMPLTIIDKNDVYEKNKEMLENDANLSFIVGENYLKNLEDFDLIIKSPGVILKDIDTSSLKITSELELMLKYYRDQTIGVTGTKGKSTVVSLMYKILEDQGKDVRLLGNIGTPIFDEIESFTDKTIIVVEMSALQLEFTDISPHIAVIINLFEEHLDHSGTVKHYHENKLNIFKYQNEHDYAIYSSDIEPLNSYIDERYKAHKYRVQLHNKNINLQTAYLYKGMAYLDNQELYNSEDKRNLIGEHNLRNIMIVLTIAKIMELNMHKAIKSVNEFKPLEHRLEHVGTYNGIIYYNDAIATIPNATINGIEALKNVNTLIFGGMDRGINYQELIDYLDAGHVANLICMPTTGYKIGKKIKNKNVNVYYAETLDEAVKLAKGVTEKDKICLLSPAAASYEYFKNFMEKGNTYKALVREN